MKIDLSVDSACSLWGKSFIRLFIYAGSYLYLNSPKANFPAEYKLRFLNTIII